MHTAQERSYNMLDHAKEPVSRDFLYLFNSISSSTNASNSRKNMFHILIIQRYHLQSS